MTTDITELVQRLKLEVHRAVSDFNPQMNIKTRDLKELVEALEKTKAKADIYDMLRDDYGLREKGVGLTCFVDWQAKRIAELESRTVTVKQGEVLVTVAGFTGCGKSAIAGEIEIAMKAIGVPVTWANGDSEKRMTGADWLAAIEMYKPTVRIVEVNIPRAAGIKVEVE